MVLIALLLFTWWVVGRGRRRRGRGPELALRRYDWQRPADLKRAADGTRRRQRRRRR